VRKGVEEDRYFGVLGGVLTRVQGTGRLYRLVSEKEGKRERATNSKLQRWKERIHLHRSNSLLAPSRRPIHPPSRLRIRQSCEFLVG
jgi:hypothetical protein